MKKGVFIIIFMLLVANLVLASIDINIKTLPNHRISVFIRNMGKLDNVDSFHKDTGDGNVKISSSVSLSKIDLLIKLKKDNVEILTENFYEVSTNKPININFIPGEEGVVDSFEAKKNDTEVNETNIAANNTEINVGDAGESINESGIEGSDNKNKGITGKAIDVNSILSSKTTYYIIGGIAVVLILGFLIQLYRNKLGSNNYKVVKYKEVDNKKLENAERKIEEARKELDEIKNRKKRLEEARERFKRDQEELEKLEKENK